MTTTDRKRATTARSREQLAERARRLAASLSETEARLEDKEREIARLLRWLADLQSGMYVNCVYCGHRYGPGETTPVSMAEALKAHVEHCPKHPMSALRAEVERLRAAVVPRPRDEYHEDNGAVLWWRLPVDEPPTVGWLDDAPDYATHWTPIGVPVARPRP